MNKIIKKVLLVLTMFVGSVMMISDVRAEEVFANINRVSYDGTVDYILPYKSLKLNDGYLILDVYYNYDSINKIHTNYLTVKKINDKGNTVWTKKIEKVRASYDWTASEHVDAVNVGDTETIIISHMGIKKIDLNTGEVIKENDEMTGYKIIEFNGNYLCVGDNVFYNSGVNKLVVIDKDLNILSEYTLEGKNSFVMTAAVEDNKIYGLFGEKKIIDNKYYTYYSLITFNDKFEIENSQDLVSEEDTYLRSYGTIDFAKLNNDFYYICHSLNKVAQDGKISYLSGDFGEGVDYTAIELIDDYVVLTGLNEDAEGNISAILEIYDTSFNLLQSINLNDEYGLDKTEDMSIIKSITKTAKGFMVNGFINNTAIVSEYELPYNIFTKTDGNGQITATKSSAHRNEEVEFEVVPNVGYSVKEVRVEASDGNSIVFSSNKFIMPNADVTIEVSFVKDEKIDILENLVNPSTGGTRVFIVIFLAIVGSILLIKMDKKKKI